MLILSDDAEHRARLIESIRRRMDEEVEEVALSVCQGRTADRAFRRSSEAFPSATSKMDTLFL